MTATRSDSAPVALDGQVVSPGDPNYDVAEHGSLKALAIYLHTLGDRISHNLCTDESYIEPASDPASGIDYSLIYPSSCAVGSHMGMHYQETGHTPVPERTADGAELVAAELEEWVAVSGYPRTVGYIANPVQRANLIGAILATAVPEACAADRLAALCTVSRDYGLGWHDGNPNCEYIRTSCSQ